MEKKSNIKFRLKGHSIPGIKGYKGDKLEDGRHGSSAFQMASPNKETKLDFDTDEVEREYKESKGSTPTWSGPKEGWGWAAFELAQLAKRRKGGKPTKEEIEKVQDVEQEVENVELPWEEGYTREDDAHYTVEELDEIDFWKKHGYWPDEETEEQRATREGEGDSKFTDAALQQKSPYKHPGSELYGPRNNPGIDMGWGKEDDPKFKTIIANRIKNEKTHDKNYGPGHKEHVPRKYQKK
jgi:hypothetical protein